MMFPIPSFDFTRQVKMSNHCAAVARQLPMTAAELALPADDGGDWPVVEEPEALFARLSKGSTALSAVELFSLLVWDSEAWESEPAERVVRHLWNSVMHQGDLRQIVLYRVLLANKEKWPGPDPLIRLLSADLKARLLLQWPDKSQARILMCLANEDAPGLADLIIKAHDADLPMRYLRRQKLLGRLPVAEAAIPFWIAGWAGLGQTKRSALEKQVGLSHVLEELDFTRSQQVAGLILDNTAIQQKIQNSQESWPALEAWFRKRNSDAMWRNGLTDLQRQRLEGWLRSVSFRDFQRWSRRIISALPEILEAHEWEQCEKQQNQLSRRVIYWQNYQQHFKQVRFLLPSETLDVLREEEVDLEVGANVSVLGQYHAGCEVGIFHVGEYCLVEFFRGKLSELRIIKGEHAHQLFTQERWTLESLRELPYEWIQDHSYFWQSELVFVLDKIFDVQPDQPKVFFGEHQWFMYGGHWMLNADKEKDRDQEVKRWVYHLDAVGKRQWEQQRRKINRLLGRDNSTQVERARTSKQFGGVNEQLSEWYKIDRNGQELPADATDWAAVYDAKSGIMWAVNMVASPDFPNPSSPMTWYEAQEWLSMVNRISWCGFSDWRMPTLEELEAWLKRAKTESGLINNTHFINGIRGLGVHRVWSSSPDVNGGNGAWIVNVGDGSIGVGYKNYGFYVRVVRSGQ